jgi:hypothetical protein
MKAPFVMFRRNCRGDAPLPVVSSRRLKVTLLDDTPLERQAPDSDQAPELNLACLRRVGWVKLHEAPPAG